MAKVPKSYVPKSLSKKDRDYQNIINRSGIKSQKNVSIEMDYGKLRIF